MPQYDKKIQKSLDEEYPKIKEKLKENLENNMQMLRQNLEIVQKYFNPKDIQYAA